MAGWAAGAAADDVASSVAQQVPLVPVGAAGAVLVLALVVWLIARHLRATPADGLRSTLAAAGEVCVLMHPNPDPDAMACALAVREIAAATDTEATLQYPGQIRHQENRAFETVLDVDFDRIEGLNELAGEEVVLVDHNQARGFPGAETIEPVAVIDHHPGNGIGTDFTDVRTDHGACASIFAEYFRDLGWEPGDPDDEGDAEAAADRRLSPTVATGLLYGIQSDTKQLTKGCSPAEFRAAEFLYDGIDQDSLDRIANPQVDAEVLDVKARAITNRTVRNAFAISDVGEVSNADAIPQAADELLRLEGVTAVVVVGDREGTMYLSGRSRDDRVHMGKVLETAVDGIPMAEAGGHARMGGGRLSVDHMEGIGPSEGTPREDLHELLFDAMAGDV